MQSRATFRAGHVPSALASALALIDAPETAQRPYDQNARQYLQQRLPVGSAVRLDEKTTNRYGRLVAEVFNGININLVLVEGGIIRPWEFRKSRRAAVIPDGTTPDGGRYSCTEIGSYVRAQELLRQGHTDRDSNRDGEACESLRR